jgi:Bacterial regulatory protein, Fis family
MPKNKTSPYWVMMFDAERRILGGALTAAGGSIRKACILLGINRDTFRSRAYECELPGLDPAVAARCAERRRRELDAANRRRADRKRDAAAAQATSDAEAEEREAYTFARESEA